MARPTLAEITAGLASRRYLLGEVDCLAVVLDYLALAGVALPESWEGISRADYPARFAADPEAAKEDMLRFLDATMAGVATAAAVAGDILVLRGADGALFPAIDAGNGRVIAATRERGVRSLPRRAYTTVRAYRCRPRCRS